MTCKDCICYAVCTFTSITSEKMGNDCKQFKNKADFVEVVRCEKCIYKDECLQKIDCECVYQELVFCSYGERRK